MRKRGGGVAFPRALHALYDALALVFDVRNGRYAIRLNDGEERQRASGADHQK